MQTNTVLEPKLHFFESKLLLKEWAIISFSLLPGIMAIIPILLIKKSRDIISVSIVMIIYIIAILISSSIVAKFTIKKYIFFDDQRQWGYNHTNLKGLKKVNGEMALIMTVYNMKRTINILGMEKLLEKIKNWKPNYKGITIFFSKSNQFNAIYEMQLFFLKIAA